MARSQRPYIALLVELVPLVVALLMALLEVGLSAEVGTEESRAYNRQGASCGGVLHAGTIQETVSSWV